MNLYAVIGLLIYVAYSCDCRPTSCEKHTPIIQRQPQRSLLVKGADEALEIKCVISGCPTSQIAWFYKNNAITKSRYPHIVLSDNHTSLKINKLTFQDRGQYTCVAANSVGSTTASFLISVRPKQTKLARVLQPPTNILASEGDTIKFTCVVTFYPLTPYGQAFGWLKDGKRADENKRRQWTETRLNGNKKKIILTISKIRREDRGVYGCVVLIDNISHNRAVANAILTINP